MDFMLGTLGVAFAAFYIWLAVRIVNRRENSRRMIWIMALAAAVLLSYLLSFGPACRLVVEGVMPYSYLEAAYQPCIRLAIHGPHALGSPFSWWAEQCGGEEILMEILILEPHGGQTVIGPFAPT